MHPELERIARGVARKLGPKPYMLPSAWADAHRVLSSLSSPEPGPWRTARAPFWREPMDRLHPDDDAEFVVVQCGTQVGKTEFMITGLMFYAHQFPRPIVYVMPTERDAEDLSTQRLEDAIKSSPAVRQVFLSSTDRDEEGRRGKETTLSKRFLGGMLFVLSATSGSQLRSKPAGVLMLDEVNGYPRELPGEGNPVDLVLQRSQNFLGRKVCIVSTPTDEGDNPIGDWYAETDQRKYETPCPECGSYFVVQFRKVPGIPGGLVWPEGRPQDARMECPHCETLIPCERRAEMLAAGRWVPTATARRPRAVGYWLNVLWSPWVTWGATAAKFELAKGDPVKMRAFVTLDLAEAWKHASGDVVSEEDLARGATGTWSWGGPVEVPAGVQVVTAGVDVQGDRIEVTACGWDSSAACWVIGHRMIWGDPRNVHDRVWRDLDELLLAGVRGADGKVYPFAVSAVDSSDGAISDLVYRWVRQRQRRRVFAVKGYTASNRGIDERRPVWPTRASVKRGQTTVHIVNVSLAKLHVTMRMAAGRVRFPSGLGGEYYAQLTSEQLVRTKPANGPSVRRWVLKKGRTRNEALDCMVYAYAAFMSLDPTRLGPPIVETEQPAPKASAPRVVDRAPPVAHAERASSAKVQKAPTARGLGGDLWRRLRRS